MQGIHSTLLEADANLAERMTAEQHSRADVDNEKLRHIQVLGSAGKKMQ
jgi:hypothetical protein